MIEEMDLEWIDPIQGASDLAATDSQEMPDDASDLMRQYAENMPVDMQDWWLAQR